MNFFVIGDEDTVLGFKLVGVQGRVAANAFEAREALKVAASTEGIGIIIITERVASWIRKEVDEYVYKAAVPLVMEIPDRKGPLKTRKTVSDLVREAVGIKI
jgi:V/A-type H+/Na+-transporting ATPase subunit F